jgi:ABC-type sugar transport system ATPase subunit
MEVVFDDVRVAYGGRTVLDIPSLRLAPGRTTAILGPNGAGKTTLLRVIAALESPSQGRVLAGGAPVQADIATRHRIAFVFQQQVFLRSSLRENLALGLMLRGVPPPEQALRIDDAAGLVGIRHLLDRLATTLSEGEGRRASLARALCLRAPLALLDEPLVGLDGDAYGRLLDELPQILSALGTTTVLVTHDRNEAMRLGQDLVVLIDGRVQAAGTTQDVARRPASAGVARVLGCTVLPFDGRTVAVAPGQLLPGPGLPGWSLQVDTLIDTLDCREIVGRIGDVSARVVLRPGDPVPERGTRIDVHAVGPVTLP